MASLEMLKKLLDEFVEKEALVNEELTVITEQIEEMESRLEKCRVRLGTIGADRTRVIEIKQRYSGGEFYQREQVVTPVAQPVMPVAQPVMPVAQSPQPVAAKPPEPAPEPPIPQPPKPEPTPIPEPPKPEPSPAAQNARSTITGINSLFGARRADSGQSSQVSFDQPDMQQQLPTPGEPVARLEQPQPQPQPAQPQPEPQPQPQPVAQEEQQAESEEDNSDTVKSINDALRSLFR
jgi:hypothetical protein